MLTLEEIIAKGQRSQTFLDSDVWQDAYNTVLTNLVSGFMNNPDKEKREEIYRQYQSLSALDHHLRGFVDDGVLAQAEIDEEAGNG